MACRACMLQRTDEQDDGAIDASSYQVDMMRCLREVNIDNNTVGWYVSAYTRRNSLRMICMS